MPLIDYDLHPMALAFGIFCFLLTSGLLATVVYISLSTPTADAQGGASSKGESFIPAESTRLPTESMTNAQAESSRSDTVTA
jgi:hypothetical protein